MWYVWFLLTMIGGGKLPVWSGNPLITNAASHLVIFIIFISSFHHHHHRRRIITILIIINMDRHRLSANWAPDIFWPRLLYSSTQTLVIFYHQGLDLICLWMYLLCLKFDLWKKKNCRFGWYEIYQRWGRSGLRLLSGFHTLSQTTQTGCTAAAGGVQTTQTTIDHTDTASVASAWIWMSSKRLHLRCLQSCKGGR